MCFVDGLAIMLVCFISSLAIMCLVVLVPTRFLRHLWRLQTPLSTEAKKTIPDEVLSTPLGEASDVRRHYRWTYGIDVNYELEYFAKNIPNAEKEVAFARELNEKVPRFFLSSEIVTEEGDWLRSRAMVPVSDLEGRDFRDAVQQARLKLERLNEAGYIWIDAKLPNWVWDPRRREVWAIDADPKTFKSGNELESLDIVEESFMLNKEKSGFLDTFASPPKEIFGSRAGKAFVLVLPTLQRLRAWFGHSVLYVRDANGRFSFWYCAKGHSKSEGSCWGPTVPLSALARYLDAKLLLQVPTLAGHAGKGINPVGPVPQGLSQAVLDRSIADDLQMRGVDQTTMMDLARGLVWRNGGSF